VPDRPHDADQCGDILVAIVERGAETLANRTRSYALAAFDFGITCKQSPRWRNKVPEFGLMQNPWTNTKRSRHEQPRGKPLSKAQVLSLWYAMGESNIEIGNQLALKFLVSSGKRVEQVLHAPWREFDREARLWLIPVERRKNKKNTREPHAVPLTDLHLLLLDEIQEYSGRGEWLFPSRDGGAHRKSDSLSQAVRRLCDKIGMERFQPRDLRSTWKTLAGSVGIDLEIRNRVQDHAMQDVGSRHYDRYSYLDEKRAAMERWTRWLERLLSGETNKKVVSLR